MTTDTNTPCSLDDSAEDGSASFDADLFRGETHRTENTPARKMQLRGKKVPRWVLRFRTNESGGITTVFYANSCVLSHDPSQHGTGSCVCVVVFFRSGQRSSRTSLRDTDKEMSLRADLLMVTASKQS